MKLRVWLSAGMLLLATHSGGALAAGVCLPLGRETSTQPEVRRGHEIRFLSRIETINRSLRAGRFEVIMLGDSLVQQWPQAEAERAFPNRRVLNAGVSGDTTSALLFRLNSMSVPATVDGKRVEIGVNGWEVQQPGTVMILLGTNDLRQNTSCDIVAGLMAVMGRVRRLWPETQILLLSLLPRGRMQGDHAAEIAEINALLRAGATTTPGGYTFVNLHGALACTGLSTCNLTRPPNYVHLTPEEYSKIAAELRERTQGN